MLSSDIVSASKEDLSINTINKYTNISFSGRVMNLFYRTLKPKRLLKKLFDNPQRKYGPLSASKSFSHNYKLSNYNVDGNELLTATKESKNTTHLIYLHGGAYVLGKDGLKNREQIMKQLIDNTESKLTFFDYPVAPEAQYKETLNGVLSSYQYLLETYPNDDFQFVGDSAGAGLALAFAQMIKDSDIKQPKKLILFSPWIDLSMSNPEINDLLELDMLLSKEALLESAKKYVGDDDLKNPLASPLYGDYTGLCPIQMFFGTHELLYADAIKLQDISTENNFDIEFNFYHKMQHVWIIAPIDESKHALNKAYEFILK